MPRLTVEEMLDRGEIRDLFTRYTHQHDVLAARIAAGVADGTEFDVFDEIFTPDAILDFTAANAPRDTVTAMKVWMAAAYSLFPAQQHLMGQSQYSFAPDRNSADVRTWVINPMAFGRSDGSVQVFTTGGYYLDHLVRTPDGWRIAERSYHPTWQMGETPAELALPAPLEPADG